jgi:hypothetical protein
MERFYRTPRNWLAPGATRRCSVSNSHVTHARIESSPIVSAGFGREQGMKKMLIADQWVQAQDGRTLEGFMALEELSTTKTLVHYHD